MEIPKVQRKGSLGSKWISTFYLFVPASEQERLEDDAGSRTGDESGSKTRAGYR